MKQIKFSIQLLIVALPLILGFTNLKAQGELDVKDQDKRVKACPTINVIWSGSISGNVVDQDLAIFDSTLPTGSTHITACTQDVCVNFDGIISGDPAGGSVLQIEAALGRTVTINVLADSGFVGSSNLDPLCLVFQGEGDIIFQFDNSSGATELFFGQSGLEAGPVKAFVVIPEFIPNQLNTFALEDGPTVTFQRTGQSCGDTNDVKVTINHGSLFTFAAFNLSPSQQTATVLFNPTNIDSGRMILNIEDQGAFVIAGCAVFGGVNEPKCDPLFNDLSLSDFYVNRPTFQNFVVTVVAQGGDCSFQSSCADLLILNKNKTLGNLLCDPWCNLGTRDDQGFVGSFNGNERYGFVIGANGQLDIQNDVSVNYVDLGRMVCPSDVFTFNDNMPNSSQVKKRNPAALTIDGYNGGSANARITIGQKSGLFFRSGVDLNGMIQNDENSSNPFTIDFSQRTPGAGNVVLSVEAPLDIFGQEFARSFSSCPLGLGYEPLSKIEILSLEVLNNGGLFDCCLPGCFPKKTFEKNQDDCFNYYRYNAASFLINNVMTLNNVTLVHSDENHKVYEKNDVLSEPTYIGGDALACRSCFNNNENRAECGPYCQETILVFEQMVFINSALWVKTDIAFTGFDLEVPNYSECLDLNISRFIFFQNGIQCDKGFGRNMILGTAQGSFACDGCTVINGDTQLDVIQNQICTEGLTTNEKVHKAPLFRQILNLQVGQNKACDTLKAYSCYGSNCNFTPACSIDTQTSIHSIYLGNKSNITVGGNAFVPDLLYSSQLNIAGNFFAFETNGGINCTPQDSLVTGTGGIFVDENGDFSICPQYRAFFGTVVAKSGNGSINLPPRQVVWAPGIGITDWKIDLSDTNLQQPVTPQPSDCTNVVQIVETPIVGEDQYYSEYKFNWFTTVKDYDLFCPFKIGLYNPCTCPPVTCSNINALPAVLGTVDQFQITGSRLGDPAHISVRGGLIREFLYIPSGHSGEEPTSVIVLSDQGTVGLGSAHRNPQSLLGSIVLGINGVTIIAEGDGQVNLNEDVIIDNICAIVRGPGFAGNTLTISSDCCRTIRVKSGACLDLSQFNGGDTIKLAGNVQLVLEPGSCILFNQTQTMDGFATLALTDNASIVLEPVVKTDSLLPDCLDITPLCQEYICCFGKVNPARVKLLGHGQIKLGGNSYFSVPKDSYLGIETLEPVEGDICPKVVRDLSCPAPAYSLDNCEVVATDITITLNDSAKFNIGNNTSEKGGVVQIGNVEDHIFNLGCLDQGTATVAFTLNVDGANAQFSIGTQGFLGFGVGVIDKSSEIPNEWLVKTLYNLDRVNLNITNGTFAHERIYSGDDARASLLAFADNNADYGFAYQQLVLDPLNLYEPLSMIDISSSSILGGGNMVLIEETGSAVHPVVTCYNGLMSPLPLTAALLFSTPMTQITLLPTNINALFKVLSTPALKLVYNEVSGSAIPESFGLINAASSDLHNNVRLGYIDNCLINRNNAFAISGDADYTTKITHAIKAGAIPVIITTKDGEVPPDNCSFTIDPCSFDCSNSPTIRPIIEMFAHKGNVL